jgi:hypothetical protein
MTPALLMRRSRRGEEARTVSAARFMEAKEQRSSSRKGDGGLGGGVGT